MERSVLNDLVTMTLQMMPAKVDHGLEKLPGRNVSVPCRFLVSYYLLQVLCVAFNQLLSESGSKSARRCSRRTVEQDLMSSHFHQTTTL